MTEKLLTVCTRRYWSLNMKKKERLFCQLLFHYDIDENTGAVNVLVKQFDSV